MKRQNSTGRNARAKDALPDRVPFSATPPGETPDIRRWAQPVVWTDRMLTTLLDNKDQGPDAAEAIWFGDHLFEEAVELQHLNQMQRQPLSTKLPQVFDVNTTGVDFDPARLNSRLIIIEFKSQLPSERLHVFRLIGWLDRFTRRINGLLDTQSSGFVKFTQPRHDALPWLRGREIRLNQRPTGVPLSLFRAVALADKHDRKCQRPLRQVRDEWSSIHHVSGFQTRRFSKFRLKNTADISPAKTEFNTSGEVGLALVTYPPTRLSRISVYFCMPVVKELSGATSHIAMLLRPHWQCHLSSFGTFGSTTTTLGRSDSVHGVSAWNPGPAEPDCTQTELRNFADTLDTKRRCR